MTPTNDEALFRELGPSARKPLESFAGLTPIQRQTIPELLAGRSCLLIAPTASGKTEAALVPLVHLADERNWRGEPRILWVAPTRALVNDLHRRLTLALQGHLSVGRRTADKHDTGVDLLVTTPESVDSMLVRGGDRDGNHMLGGVRAIVLDELHLLADGPRGSQLNILLARLEKLTGQALLTVGLSATVSNAEQLATRFLGSAATVVSAGCGRSLFVHHQGTGFPDATPGQVDPLADQLWRVRRSGGGADMAKHLLDLRRDGRLKALVFVASRARCDKVSSELSRLLGSQSPVPVVAHHGSLSKEERERAEKILNESEESVAVATATLEIGIDIGDITSVVLDGPPGSVSSLLQRVGRANRSGGQGETHVLPLAGTLIEACILASMLRAARNGELDPSHTARHYSVAIQQAASTLRQSRTHRVPRAEFASHLAREFGSAGTVLVEGLEAGSWLEGRGEGLVAPADLLRELMDSDRRLHANIGDAAGMLPVVDDVTGEPIAWVPRQAVANPILLAGRIFDAERTTDAIRVRERSKPMGAESLRYATRKAPVMRSALRHLAFGLGLQETALVPGPTGWVHFGGALYAAMLRLLGVAGGALSSETDPRRVKVATLPDVGRRNWEGLETLFGFGPFQRSLPAELRRAAVVDSLPVEAFTTWLDTLEEISLSDDQKRVLYE